MFSNNIESILYDLKNQSKIVINNNSELHNLFLNGSENDKKLACLIFLAVDNKELNIYRDPNMVISMFRSIMKDLLLESEFHKELGELIKNIYTNFNYFE
jgi:hypothetical protein